MPVMTALVGEPLLLRDFVISDEDAIRVRIWVTDTEYSRGEIGFFFRRDVWSQGYATEAVRLVLAFGRDELRLRGA